MDKPQIPHLDYLTWGNSFTGSARDFRFRIVPVEKILQVDLYEKYCYEAACEKGLVFASAEFALEQAGYDQMHIWILKQWEDYCKKA